MPHTNGGPPVQGRPLEITLKIGCGNVHNIIITLDFEQPASLGRTSSKNPTRWQACATRPIGPGELAALAAKKKLSRQHPPNLQIIRGGRL